MLLGKALLKLLEMIKGELGAHLEPREILDDELSVGEVFERRG